MWPGPGLRHKLAHDGARRRSTKGPWPFKEEARKAQSVKRISFSLQTSNASASLLLPPSKVAATETVQPFSLGSLTAVRPLGASGFESVAVCSSALMTSPVTVFALALTTVTATGGPFWTDLVFGAAASDAAAASPGAEPGTVGEGLPNILGEALPNTLCALTAVISAKRAAQADPTMRE